MASVSTYLNFPGNTEEAFNFYKAAFKSEFAGEIMRMGSVPPTPDQPPMAEADKNLVMHVSLPILGGVYNIMGTDATESMGFNVVFGNNNYICLSPDTRVETKRLFDELSAGGKVEMELQDMFWGDYYGTCADKFGVKWMFNCASKS
jgi:PhnB protein